MTIPGKIEASRSNSLKSTGPKTLRGRSLSRFNAVKHGVFSTRSLLPGEDQAEFNELSAILFDEYKPMTTIERILVERLVAGKLRIDRIERAKSAYFEEIRWSILVRTLRTLTHDEFEVAKSIVPNKELLRAAGNARANQKLEMLAATLGLANFSEGQPQKSPLSPDESNAMLDSVKRKIEGAENLDRLLLEGMALSDKFLSYNTLESARRTEERDLVKNHANLLELQQRRLTIKFAPIVETDRSAC